MNSVQENYLKTILSFELEGVKPTIGLIAGNLSIKSGSVSEMIKKLANQAYVKHENYKIITLTEKGRSVATRILRRHRLWETFLCTILKLPWSEVHEEAEKFEHMTSDRIEKSIDELLNFPQFDPHGHPIPSSSGEMKQASTRPKLIALSALQPGRSGKIEQVNDSHPSLLKYLDEVHLTLKSTVYVHKIVEFDGSMEIEYNRRRILLSKQIADEIAVQIIS